MWHISVWVALLWLPLATPLVAVRAGVVVQGSMRSTPSRPATAACPSAARLRGSDGCRRRSSEVRMFGPGGGGGFLGVGTPEMVVIGAVAWALIGPKELYKLAQQAGQFLGEWQQLGRQAQSTFKDALESELGNDLMDKAKEAGSEATSIAQKMQTELAQTDFRGKVKDLADYAKPVAESAAAAAAAASTAAGAARVAAASSASAEHSSGAKRRREWRGAAEWEAGMGACSARPSVSTLSISPGGSCGVGCGGWRHWCARGALCIHILCIQNMNYGQGHTGVPQP